jgi:hypothetical protein
MTNQKIVSYVVEDTDNRDPQTTLLYLKTPSGITTATCEVDPTSLFQNVLDNTTGAKVKLHINNQNQIVISFVIPDQGEDYEMMSLVVHPAP